MFERDKDDDEGVMDSQPDSAIDAMLELSEDIGEMADRIGEMSDRIGDMADRIGDMSERILETQRIQGKNIEMLQESVMQAMAMMGKQMEVTNRILASVVDASVDEGLELPGKD